METEQFEGMLGVAETLAKAFEEYMAAKQSVASADAALNAAKVDAASASERLSECTRAYENAKIELVGAIENL